MIEIVNEQGRVLDLSENFALTIESNNPLFLKEDEFFQDISYPGKTALTENNKLFIGSGHLAERSIYKYELSVNVYIDSTLYFSGTFAYDIDFNEISFFLKIGYGNVAEKCETTYLHDLSYNGNLVIDHFKKNDSILNPKNYPYAYFPIFHDTVKVEQLNEAGQPVQYFTNEFNFTTQELVEWTGGMPQPFLTLPHFKLVHILHEVSKFLGFEATGGFFSDPIIKTLYIQNLQFTRIPRISEKYSVPHITISDLFKALKLRFKVNITFDMVNRRAVFSAPNTLLQSHEYVDVSEYVAEIQKIMTPDRMAYKIESDQEASEYNPPNFIEVKDPNFPDLLTEEIVVPVSTLPKQSSTDGYSYPITTLPFLTGRAVNPTGGQVLFRTPYDSARHAAIKLLRYPGLKLVSPDKYFPQAEPVEFNTVDGDWYAFLNDSKLIQLRAFIPNHILTQITPLKKIAFRTREDFLMVGIIKKMDYTLTNRRRELTEVVFELYSLLEKKSVVSLVNNPLVPDEQTGRKKNHNTGPRPF